MKVLRFNDNRVGVLKNGTHVVDLSSTVTYRAEKGPQRVLEEIIETFDTSRQSYDKMIEQESGVPLSSVKLLPPIPRPSKCLAAFVNYIDRPERNADNIHNEFFYKSPELLGPEGSVELPDIPQVVVYQPEAELAFVMGKKARHVKEDNAMNYVFGYIPFFDISARGMTRRTHFLGKGMDTFGACGPWITTADEIRDPHSITVRSWVNGQLRQNYSTEHMAHKIPDLIAWVTRFVSLQPGDVIATGTYHPGLGPINDGDVLEIEIEKLGKARFFVKGYGPRKDTEWMPGVSKPTPPATGGTTKV